MQLHNVLVCFSLEMKLNQRRARVTELRKKQEDLKRRNQHMNEKEREKLEAELVSAQHSKTCFVCMCCFFGGWVHAEKRLGLGGAVREWWGGGAGEEEKVPSLLRI